MMKDANEIEAFMSAGGEQPEAATGLAAGVVEYDNPLAGTAVHHLLSPFSVDGVRIASVSVRMATQDDIDDWGSGALASNRALLSRLTGLDAAVLGKLRWPDAEAVIRLFEAAVPAFVVSAIEEGRSWRG